jgi:hypothetical protein
MRSKADLRQPLPTNLDLQVLRRDNHPFIRCRISRSITQITGSAVTKRAGGVLSGIFVQFLSCEE